MSNKLPCYIVLDLLPLYQDDILSEQAKQDVEQHVCECEECKKAMDNMKIKIDFQSTSSEIKNNPLKKIKFYQKIQTFLGTIIAFFLGMCLPVVKIMISIIGYGEIPDYYLARLKAAWHIGVFKMLVSGIIVCVLYIVVVFLLKKIVSNRK